MACVAIHAAGMEIGSADISETVIHASAVAVAGRGVLLLGGSGAGKSDLALRLIDAGAELIADDQVVLKREAGGVMAHPSPNLPGHMELRGMGIYKMKPVSAPLALAVLLDKAADRLPEAADMTAQVMGGDMVQICIDPAAASAVARIHLALDVLAGHKKRIAP